MDGVLLIDKPAGITSAGVLRRLERVHKIKKIGHAGTLDPEATGLLVVLCGKATTLQEFLMFGRKVYSGEIQLGIGTDTDDLAGEVILRDPELDFWQGNSPAQLVAKIKGEFSGVQQQVPPQYSAIKVQGKAGYKMARAGQVIEHKPREVEIEFRDLEFITRDKLKYCIECSKGTYVRSLARDIGKSLSTCAALASIRREASGSFRVEGALSLEASLEPGIEQHLLSLEFVLEDWPRILVSASEAAKLLHGNQTPLASETAQRVEGLRIGQVYYAKVISEDGSLIALVQRAGGDQCWKLR